MKKHISNCVKFRTGRLIFGYPETVTLKKSELPEGSVVVKDEPNSPCVWAIDKKKPVMVHETVGNTRPGIRKAHIRPGLHRLYHDTTFTIKNHGGAKRHVHRSSRRKTKVYFSQVDPEDDHDSNIEYGLSAFDF